MFLLRSHCILSICHIWQVGDFSMITLDGADEISGGDGKGCQIHSATPKKWFETKFR